MRFAVVATSRKIKPTVDQHLYSQIVHRRPHKLDPGLLQFLGKSRILAEEAIPGMDRLDAVLNAHVDDRVNVQISGNRTFVGRQLEGLVGLVPVLGEPICSMA